jgi:Na+/melibiose symporter-like transporter
MIATAACTQALIPDIADYEFYKSGNYMPGTVSAVYAFIDKAVSSFGATIVAASIAATAWRSFYTSYLLDGAALMDGFTGYWIYFIPNCAEVLSAR